MKRYSISSNPLENIMKVTKRYPATTIRMAIIKKQKITSIGGDVEKLESLFTVGGNIKWNRYYMVVSQKHENQTYQKKKSIIQQPHF